MEVFYTAAMTLNAICALAIMLSGIQKNEKHFFTLALLNVLLFFFHLLSWQLHASTTLDTAIQMSRYQTMVAIIALPLVTVTFGNWCKFKYTSQLTLALAVASIPFLILNFLGESSLRYSGTAELIQIQTIFGNQISLLRGSPSLLFIGIHLIFITNSILLAIFSYRFFRQRESVLSISLIIYLLSQVPVNFVGYKIDKLEWQFFYIGGLPLTIFSVICLLLISSMYKSTTAKLKAGEAKKLAIDGAISALAQETSGSDNINFYKKTVLNIQHLFKTKFVFIGVYFDDEAGRRIQTLSVVNDGEFGKNFSYALKGTPCDNVVNKTMCTFEDDVDLSFPEDLLLINMGIKAYIGL